MNISIPIDNYNDQHLFFGEPIKNNVINNSVFRRIIYSNDFVSLNNIRLIFELNNISVKKFYNKYRCFINNSNDKHIQDIRLIENSILMLLDIKKKPIFSITQQIKEGNIKIFSETEIEGKHNFLNLVLKISGIWESEYEYGLTFKFLYTNDNSYCEL